MASNWIYNIFKIGKIIFQQGKGYSKIDKKKILCILKELAIHLNHI